MQQLNVTHSCCTNVLEPAHFGCHIVRTDSPYTCSPSNANLNIRIEGLAAILAKLMSTKALLCKCMSKLKSKFKRVQLNFHNMLIVISLHSYNNLQIKRCRCSHLKI